MREFFISVGLALAAVVVIALGVEALGGDGGVFVARMAGSWP